jgi:hypothetical protein
MALSDNVMDYIADNATNKFQDRCLYFFAKYAVQTVMQEADTVTDHQERVEFAGQVLSGSFPDKELAIGVATNPTVAATIDGAGTPTDNDLEYVVNNEAYNAIALSIA